MASPTKNLWAPWRLSYLESNDHVNQIDALPTDTEAPAPLKRGNGCFLCDAVRDDLADEEAADRLILIRRPAATLLLNRFPYANSHLLVTPASHVVTLSDLSDDQRTECMELAEVGCRLLTQACHAQGFNVGINIGRAAGAGVPGHLHLHVVPRWHGDVNFIQTVAGVRVIPASLQDSYQRLRDAVTTLDVK